MDSIVQLGFLETFITVAGGLSGRNLMHRSRQVAVWGSD